MHYRHILNKYMEKIRIRQFCRVWLYRPVDIHKLGIAYLDTLKQEVQTFKVLLSYTVNSKPFWVRCDPDPNILIH